MNDVSIPKIKAIQLLNNLKITKLDYLKYLEEICCEVGPRVKYEEILGAEGRLVTNGDLAIITVPKDENYKGRTRFSIAHELGQYILHLKEDNFFNCSALDMTSWGNSSNRNIEYEANVFASELLMPSSFLSEHIKDNELTLEFLKETANEFETSLTATIYKMVEVSKRAVAVVVFRDGAAKYSFRSKILQGEGLWVELGILNDKTLASQCFKTGQTYIARQQIEPMSWFDDKRITNYGLREEVIFFKHLGFGMSILEIIN